MQTNKGVSIFWLGLLGFVFFPLGILSIVLGLIQVKKKVATGWTKVGLALGFVSTIIGILTLAFLVYSFETFFGLSGPSHKAVPLVSSISTSEIQPPFKTPEQFITGYNQLMQALNEKGLGSSVFQIEGYFQTKNNRFQEAQRDLEELHNLNKVITNKLGSEQSKEFIESLRFSKLPYIRPTTLAKKTDQSYSAIDTAGYDVHLVNAQGSWKISLKDTLGLEIFYSIVPSPGIIDSVTKQVKDGSLTSSKAVLSALIKASDNVQDKSNSSTKQ
jgi:hypothetical protein